MQNNLPKSQIAPTNSGEQDDTNQPPEMPNNANNFGEQGDTNQPPELPDNSNGQMANPENSMESNKMGSGKLIGYYVLIVVQSLCLAAVMVYLIMSAFNKKTFKQTFILKDKIIIYILSVVLLAEPFAVVGSCTVKNSSVKMQNNQINQNKTEQSTANIVYSGAFNITKDTEILSGSYNSANVDENAVLVNGNLNATIKNITVEKTGDSNGGDTTSFYGVNSAILAKSGANLSLENITVTTNAVGANGVFSYGGSATTNNTSTDGTTVTVKNSKITTKKDNSGGIMTTGGGITNAYNLNVNTLGISSAAIRTDRGGGKVNVEGGSYKTSGSGSPAVYSTAEITVKNATLVSKASEGIVVEGKNSVVIENCNLTDTNTKLNGLSTTYKNIFLYQSISGNADTGNSSFTAVNSKITTNKGDTFYITNTSSTVTLSGNTIVNTDNSGNFLRAQADSWGNKGSNGGEVTLILNKQKAVGNIVIDNVSTLNMELNDSSYYEGTINSSNNAKLIELKLDKSSRIKLTGNSYVTSFENEDLTNSNIDFNGYKLYVNGKELN